MHQELEENAWGLGLVNSGKDCRALLVSRLEPHQLTLSPGFCRDS